MAESALRRGPQIGKTAWWPRGCQAERKGCSCSPAEIANPSPSGHCKQNSALESWLSSSPAPPGLAAPGIRQPLNQAAASDRLL